MKIRRRLILAVVLLAVVVGGAICLRPPAEPSYAGHTLSEWLQFDLGGSPATPPPPGPAEAIRHMGSHAIPFLLRWIEYDPNRRTLSDRTVGWMHTHLPKPLKPRYRPTKNIDPGFLFAAAPYGLRMLGPSSAPAIPELERIASDRNDGHSALQALNALSFMGAQGLPPLERIAQDTNAPYNWAARHYVEELNRKMMSATNTAPGGVR